MACLKWFDRHDWGRWEVTEKVPVGHRIPGEEPRCTGYVIYQQRVCKQCGYTQVTKQRVGL